MPYPAANRLVSDELSRASETPGQPNSCSWTRAPNVSHSAVSIAIFRIGR